MLCFDLFVFWFFGISLFLLFCLHCLCPYLFGSTWSYFPRLLVVCFYHAVGFLKYMFKSVLHMMSFSRRIHSLSGYVSHRTRCEAEGYLSTHRHTDIFRRGGGTTPFLLGIKVKLKELHLLSMHLSCTPPPLCTHHRPAPPPGLLSTREPHLFSSRRASVCRSVSVWSGLNMCTSCRDSPASWIASWITSEDYTRHKTHVVLLHGGICFTSQPASLVLSSPATCGLHATQREALCSSLTGERML